MLSKIQYLQKSGPKEIQQTTHQNFVFKCCSEYAFRFAQCFLDLTSNSRDCSQSCTLHFCNFKCRVKHVFDKRSILEDFVWCTSQFKFLYNFSDTIIVKNHSSSGNSKGIMAFRYRLNAAETSVWRCYGSIKGSKTVHMLGSIL